MVQKISPTCSIVHNVSTQQNSLYCACYTRGSTRKCFFAHPENILLGMLGDDDEEIRRLTVNKIQALRGRSLQHTILNNNFKGGYIKEYGKKRRCC